MLLLAPYLRFQSCCNAAGASSWIQGANLGLSKVKEIAFKALLGLFAIIVTEATDGPSLCVTI